MLWYKAWVESRWRFLIGLGVLLLLACGPVFEYPAVQRLLPLARPDSSVTPGVIGRAIREALEVERDYRGYVWYQWFRQIIAPPYSGVLHRAQFFEG